MNLRAKQTAHEVQVRRAFGERGRVRKRLPRQHLATGLERDYARALVALVKEMQAAYQPLLEALPRLTGSVIQARTRLDAGEVDEAARLFQLASAALARSLDTSRLDGIARAFGKKTSDFQKKQLQRQIKSALGVDVFMGDRQMPTILDDFTKYNVSLIKNISDKLRGEIELKVMNALTSGTLHKDLAKDLEKSFGFAEDRAKLIARDQVGKIYSDVNRVRQVDLGVTRFIWRTANDSRVRESHRELEGDVFTYKEGADGIFPGSEVLCRCFAEPVLDDILDEL